MTAEIVISNISNSSLIDAGEEVDRVVIEDPEQLGQVEGVMRQVLDKLNMGLPITDGYATLVELRVPNELRVDGAYVENSKEQTRVLMDSPGSSFAVGTRVGDVKYKVEVRHL